MLRYVCLAIAILAFQTINAGGRMDKDQEMREAVAAGDAGKVGALIKQDPALAKIRDKNGVSLILVAIFSGRAKIADQLASDRVDLDLFEAAALGRTDRARQLLGKDPKLSAEYAADGFTALHYAAHLGHYKIAEMLIASGADVKALSRNGLSLMPLQSAVAGRRLEIARLLLEKGAPVNARQEKDTTTVLHVAAFIGDLEMIKLLLSFGADLNVKQKADDKTPLALALEKGHRQVVDLLRQHGAQ
jgi:ankyrin repeat protein